MPLDFDAFKQMADDAHVSMSMIGRSVLTGEPVERLPPRLWEDLRLRLQGIYRRATGEEFAVIKIEEGEQ